MSEIFLIGMPADDRTPSPELAGSKASELWRMAKLGLPVPPAFVLPTTWCAPLNRGEGMDVLERGLKEGIARLEDATARRFGDARAPLLVSVRSGAARSMPGMMATILDVGLNPATLHGLIAFTGNPRLAFDSYRRFIQIYSEAVENAPAAPFEAELARMIGHEGAHGESDLDSEALERLAQDYREIAGECIPDNPHEQLRRAALAVYRSWEAPPAREYRRLKGLENLPGTAVTVQAMVFGNAGRNSGAGVAFSRNPATGANELYVDFLFNAQGEDVVAGRRSPGDAKCLSERLPEVARALSDGIARLERELRDMQDVEFTVERGKLFFLQTRTAQRTQRAALRVLVDMEREGLIDRKTALSRAGEVDIARARIKRFADQAVPIASAVAASPGVASGRIAFDSERAKALAERGDPVILVRRDTATEDVAGFAVAAGILTARGGRTAHAAVVARQMGKVCLVGCGALTIDEAARKAAIAGHAITEGDWLSLDGETGDVTLGRREVVTELPSEELAEIARWRAP